MVELENQNMQSCSIVNGRFDGTAEMARIRYCLLQQKEESKRKNPQGKTERLIEEAIATLERTISPLCETFLFRNGLGAMRARRFEELHRFDLVMNGGEEALAVKRVEDRLKAGRR